MGIFFSIISFLLLIALLVFPIVLFKKIKASKFKFLIYFGAGTIISILFISILGWWSDKSTELLLSQNGFNFDAMNDSERYANVASENLDKVKSLEISKNGIGWPAKVMVIYPFYFVYILLFYLVMNLIKIRK